jgi:ribosome biogenesis GTPase
VKGKHALDARPGRVVATAGRRVWVRDADGDRTCFLAGQRVVVGDRVTWVEASGEGGRVVDVADRDNALVRLLGPGQEQVLAANLAGVFVVVTPRDPPFRPGLLDRYLVAASAAHLRTVVLLNKVDLGVEDEVSQALALRSTSGLEVVHVSAKDDSGFERVRALVAEADGPWTLVGHSGTGKTSIAQRLLPGEDVGEIGQMSEYWGTGRHTTTGSRLFSVPTGGELVDSPGIRTFAPGRMESEDVRLHFPGFEDLRCKYRDCVHREGEAGCGAPDAVAPELLASYRRLYDEIAHADAATRGGRRTRET